jgi:NAD(P)-dependent dehydrogenase (short-subunit alcohol dehydrogenase family)
MTAHDQPEHAATLTALVTGATGGIGLELARLLAADGLVVMPGLLTKLLSLAGELPPRRIALEVNRVLWTPRS